MLQMWQGEANCECYKSPKGSGSDSNPLPKMGPWSHFSSTLCSQFVLFKSSLSNSES